MNELLIVFLVVAFTTCAFIISLPIVYIYLTLNGENDYENFIDFLKNI